MLYVADFDLLKTSGLDINRWPHCIAAARCSCFDGDFGSCIYQIHCSLSNGVLASEGWREAWQPSPKVARSL